jgi:DNA (cytosine-5)-methyltransferase 1
MKRKNAFKWTLHKARGPQVVELFAGAGLFGYAFKQEGFRLGTAYERDSTAAATYARNVGTDVKVCDLAKQRPDGKAEVLIAGPPCQGYSSLGKRDPDDPRNCLALVIPHWAVALDAKLVVVENVALFLKSSIWERLRTRFERANYETFFWIVNAADVGAPQRRVRSFTVFSRVGRPDLESCSPPARSTVRDAFAGLPPFPCRKLQHFTLPRTELALKRIRLVPEGGDIRDVALKARHLVPPSWFRTRGKIIDIWGRMRWDDTAPTIRTGFLNPSRGRFLHPTEDRPISFREGARLQMVPDDFQFEGKAEQMARQIGNGVSVGVGRCMARAVFRLIG